MRRAVMHRASSIRARGAHYAHGKVIQDGGHRNVHRIRAATNANFPGLKATACNPIDASSMGLGRTRAKREFDPFSAFTIRWFWDYSAPDATGARIIWILPPDYGQNAGRVSGAAAATR